MVTHYLQPDAYQEAWVRFLRYDPYTFGGACLMARHAALTMARGERRRFLRVDREVEVDSLPSGDGDVPAGEERLAELWERFPAEVPWLLAYYGSGIHQPNIVRTRVSRLVARMRREVLDAA